MSGQYLSGDELFSLLTEEELHLFILAHAKRFGIEELAESSFNKTPDIVGYDKDGYRLNIEVELADYSLTSHISKNQTGQINRCFYIQDKWDKMKTVFKKPDHIIFTQIRLTQKDVDEIKNTISEKLWINWKLKQLIEQLCLSRGKEKIHLQILVDQYFYSWYGRLSINYYGIFTTHSRVRTLNLFELKKLLQKMPRSYVNGMIDGYDKLLKINNI